jgi:RHS repeat-associated protein
LPPSYGFGYDAENRVISETNSGGLNASYFYDGLGERVEKQLSNGQATVYVYDAFGQLAEEYSPVGTWSKDYIPFNGQTAAIENAAASPCTTCYLSYNYLGTPSMVTDANANVVARHDYIPFGEEIPAGTAGRNSQFGPYMDNVDEKFTGQVRDNETLNDFFNARYYTAPLARFLSPDPGNAGADLTNPQSWNGYAYVLNNPLALVDPSGMDTSNDCGGPCVPFSYVNGTCVVSVSYHNQTDSTGTWAMPDFTFEGCSSNYSSITTSTLSVASAGNANAPAKKATPDYCAYQGSALSPQQYAAQGKSFGAGIAALGQSYGPDVALSLGLGTLYGQFSKCSMLDAQPRATGTPLQRASYGNLPLMPFSRGRVSPCSTRLLPRRHTDLSSSSWEGTRGAIWIPHTRIFPAVNVQDITNGYNAASGGTLCGR